MAEPDASARIGIKASPDQVYELISDIRTMTEMAEETVAFQWLGSASATVVGARFRGTNRKGVLRWSTVRGAASADPSRVLFGFN